MPQSISIFDSTRPAASPKKKKRVADRTPEEVAAYKQNMERVRAQVEEMRSQLQSGDLEISPLDIQTSIELLSPDLLEEIINDPNKRPHRRICQGRAASCKPESDRCQAYIEIAAVKRSTIERGIALFKGLPDPGEPKPRRQNGVQSDPELQKYQTAEGVFSFGDDAPQTTETDWQRQLREAKEKLEGKE